MFNEKQIDLLIKIMEVNIEAHQESFEMFRRDVLEGAETKEMLESAKDMSRRFTGGALNVDELFQRRVRIVEAEKNSVLEEMLEIRAQLYLKKNELIQ